MRVIPCEHMHLTSSPLECPCPLLEEGPPGAGLRRGICGNRDLPSFPGSLCRGPVPHGHSGVQAARATPPVTLSPSESHLGLPWLRVAVTVAGQFTEEWERPGSRLPVSPSNPDLHLFLKTVFYTVCIYFFLFCLLFNPYLDSFETLQSDLTLELSVARAPHATGGCPKAPCAVLPGSPCTSVSPAAP